MKERDCANCKHHTEDGCSKWDCEFEAKDLISRAEVHKTLSLLATEGGTDAKMLLSDAHEFIDALPSADAVPQLKQTDTLIIADALRYLAQDTERHLVDRTRADALRQQFLKYGASMCKGGDSE